MTAAGQRCLDVAYGEIGVTEQPPGSNQVKYWDPWGGSLGAWCAAFVSWCCSAAGFPVPPIDGAPGFASCPSGSVAAHNHGANLDPSQVEPGDILIFSWEPWHYANGIPVCSGGAYAGAPAGDHTGFFAGWADGVVGGRMTTVEGNTSQSSWDNGGAVLERHDRYGHQICCYARHAAIRGGPAAPQPEEWDDMNRALLVTTAGSPWNGSIFLCNGTTALGIGDAAILSNQIARGLCNGAIVEVNEWDITGGYQLAYPMGPGAVPRG